MTPEPATGLARARVLLGAASTAEGALRLAYLAEARVTVDALEREVAEVRRLLEVLERSAR